MCERIKCLSDHFRQVFLKFVKWKKCHQKQFWRADRSITLSSTKIQPNSRIFKKGRQIQEYSRIFNQIQENSTTSRNSTNSRIFNQIQEKRKFDKFKKIRQIQENSTNTRNSRKFDKYKKFDILLHNYYSRPTPMPPFIFASKFLSLHKIFTQKDSYHTKSRQAPCCPP